MTYVCTVDSRLLLVCASRWCWVCSPPKGRDRADDAAASTDDRINTTQTRLLHAEWMCCATMLVSICAVVVVVAMARFDNPSVLGRCLFVSMAERASQPASQSERESDSAMHMSQDKTLDCLPGCLSACPPACVGMESSSSSFQACCVSVG
uniref:Uncharacterized protein n=1 Tax=Vitrella brassicaformis TaxID=1169539 RepID=A0A7S1P247_9ALVE